MTPTLGAEAAEVSHFLAPRLHKCPGQVGHVCDLGAIHREDAS